MLFSEYTRPVASVSGESLDFPVLFCFFLYFLFKYYVKVAQRFSYVFETN